MMPTAGKDTKLNQPSHILEVLKACISYNYQSHREVHTPKKLSHNPLRAHAPG